MNQKPDNEERPMPPQAYTADVPPFNADGSPIKDDNSMLLRRESVVEAGRRIAEEDRRTAIDGHRPDSNPKSALGIKKPPLHLVSPISILHECMAMSEGAMKYGPYNYREDAVAATVYIAAALRHLQAYAMGEDYAPDSKFHHLAHAKACCGIILDAEANGSLIDDRFKSPAYLELCAKFEAELPGMAERIAGMKDQLEAHNR